MRKEIGDKVKPFERPIDGDWPYLYRCHLLPALISTCSGALRACEFRGLRRPWNVKISLSRSRVRTRDTVSMVRPR